MSDAGLRRASRLASLRIRAVEARADRRRSERSPRRSDARFERLDRARDFAQVLVQLMISPRHAMHMGVRNRTRIQVGVDVARLGLESVEEEERYVLWEGARLATPEPPPWMKSYLAL
jgi:hypothetical protein